MPDRGKVIKGVHDARRYLEDREWVDKSVGVHINALNDALAMLKEQEHKDLMYHALEDDWKRLQGLLKEQEAVKLHTIDTDEEQYSFWFVCGNCGWKIYKVVDDENCEDRKQIHFCASCGRTISWGGRRSGNETVKSLQMHTV